MEQMLCIAAKGFSLIITKKHQRTLSTRSLLKLCIVFFAAPTAVDHEGRDGL
jgi:hypothetical protein